MKKFTKIFVLIFIASLIVILPTRTAAQSNVAVFEKIELLQPDGKIIRETNVRVRFTADAFEIESIKTGAVIKKWSYADITGAEYSYTKKPRWKTGLGLGAASFIFPPLLLIALPLGFSKHRRHWVTISTGDDFAVLKISKSIRKLFIPSFETRTSVRIVSVGDEK
jgi:hypothetical protein